MPFLRRDFTQPEHSSWRKRLGPLTMFFQADGKLIAAYSYNTALVTVKPDADQLSGIRIHLNITKYSKGSTEHMLEVISRLCSDYGNLIDYAAEADSVAVGTSAEQLPELCGTTLLPEFVRSRVVAGRPHLTMRDLRRTRYQDRMKAYTDASTVHFCFTTADDKEVGVDVVDGVVDYDADCENYTITPDAYQYVLATQQKLAALADARGDVGRCNGYYGYVQTTYCYNTK